MVLTVPSVMPRRPGPLSRPWVGLYVLPGPALALLALLSGLDEGPFLAALGAGAALLVLWGRVGKYPALVFTWGLWIALLGVLAPPLARLAGDLGMAIAFGLASVLPTFAMVRIGLCWGGLRYAKVAREGRPIREWQWVQTGRAFALSHALARRLGGVLFVLAFIFVQWAVTTAGLVASGVWWGWLIWVPYSALVWVTLVALIRRHPVAWPLAWVPLALGAPLSIPLIYYWAEGVRPNLIYRHRFERLVPLEGDDVP